MLIARTTVASLFAGLALVACGGNDTSGDEVASGASSDGGPVMIELAEQNGSGQTGTATFTATGPLETRVVVEVTNPPAETQPIHVHEGSCADIDPEPLYGLPNLQDGRTEATVPASLDQLTAGGLALNAHRSDEQIDLYVACGDLPGPVQGASGSSDGDGY
jgi:Cu/Zn superoxide dismutase